MSTFIYLKYTIILMEIIDQIKDTNNNVIITFCNQKYIKLGKLWINELKKINVHNFLIVSCDILTYRFFKKLKCNTMLCEYNNKESFWVYRIAIITDIIKKGYNVIHSDLDAIWKKNILSEFNNDVDINISQGTTFPESSLLKHGFVLCCGLFYVKSNLNTLRFFDLYNKTLKKIKDDQITINNLLFDTVWKKSKSIKTSKYTYFTDNITGYNDKHNLRLCLISMLKVQREYLDDSAFIYHVLTPKICQQKIDRFIELGIIPTKK
jgi:hypothetical protein